MTDNELSQLTSEQCKARLAASQIGRLAFLDRVGVLPMVIPVNYTVWKDTVVFRTGAGSKLNAALANAAVAFEIDGLDPEQQTGWSVVVRGRTRVLPSDEAAEVAGQLILWAPGARAHYIQITPQLISGRQLSVPASARSWWG